MTTDTKPLKKRLTGDVELLAIADIQGTLDSLPDEDTRSRVLDYVNRRNMVVARHMAAEPVKPTHCNAIPLSPRAAGA